MSKFIKNLKSLFVTEEEGTETPSNDVPQQTEKIEKVAPSHPKMSIPKVSMDAKGHEKFLNVLLGALEKANMEGYDYLEFMNAIKSLEKMDMNEATRFKSAYTLAQTMGVTPQHLEKTAIYYIDVLKKEDSKFKNALKNQQSSNINKRKQDIAQNKTAIGEKQKHIVNLQKEIENHKKHITKLENELEAAKAKVASANANFVAAYQQLVNKINSDIAKMKQYLK